MSQKPMKCEKCGKDLTPAPARWDGEPTFVGYFRCDCTDRAKEQAELYKATPRTKEDEEKFIREINDFRDRSGLTCLFWLVILIGWVIVLVWGGIKLLHVLF